MDRIPLQRLPEQARQLEQKYGWSTDLFLQKFEAGEIGDEHELFVWYALAQGIKYWQRHPDSLV